MARGWTSAELGVVTDDERMWTVAQAACLLGLPDTKMRRLVRESSLEPSGKRRTTMFGKAGGRYARVYLARDVIRAYEGLSRITG